MGDVFENKSNSSIATCKTKNQKMITFGRRLAKLLIITGVMIGLLSIGYGLKSAVGLTFSPDYPTVSKEKRELSSFDFVVADSKGYVYCFQNGTAINIYDHQGKFLKSYCMEGYVANNVAVDMIDDNACAAFYHQYEEEHDYEILQYKYGDVCYFLRWKNRHILEVYDNEEQKCFERDMGREAIEDYEIFAYLEEDGLKGVLCRKGEECVLVTANSEIKQNKSVNCFLYNWIYITEDPKGTRYEIRNVGWLRGQKLVRVSKDGEEKVLDSCDFHMNAFMVVWCGLVLSMALSAGGARVLRKLKK